MSWPDAILLDTSILSQVTHPKTSQNRPVAAWLKEALAQGIEVLVPEISDYELRRSLLRIKSQVSLQRLDGLGTTLPYLPLTTSIMREAAELWAQARLGGYPTAPDDALDGDVILAAQARSVATNGRLVMVATDNVGHLSRFVSAAEWKDIGP